VTPVFHSKDSVAEELRLDGPAVHETRQNRPVSIINCNSALQRRYNPDRSDAKLTSPNIALMTSIVVALMLRINFLGRETN